MGHYHGKHRRQHAFSNPAFDRPGTTRINTAAAAIIASALLAAVTAVPAYGAAQQPSPPSPAALATAARYVHVRDGHIVLDARDAEHAGALAAGTSLVTSLNLQLDHPQSPGAILDAARAGAPQTFTILPGITLTVSNTMVQLNLTKEAVTEIQNVLGLSQGVASLVGAILGAVPVQGGPQIAAVVGASIGVGSDLFRFCVAPDGSAAFTITLVDGVIPVPSCSGISAALA